MTEQYTTYWPTFEGLRVCQTFDQEELAQLEHPLFELDKYKRLARMSYLKMRIRERANKMSGFSKLARNILTNTSSAPTFSDGYEGETDEQPF